MSNENPEYFLLLLLICVVGFCAMGAIGLVLLQLAERF